MAYAPDETNNFGMKAARGFAFDGQGYAAGEFFYGTREQFEALYRLGVFGFERPLWLTDALPIGTYGEVPGLEPKVSWLEYGDINGLGRTDVPRRRPPYEFMTRSKSYGLPDYSRPCNWEMVFAEQHHAIG